MSPNESLFLLAFGYGFAILFILLILGACLYLINH